MLQTLSLKSLKKALKAAKEMMGHKNLHVCFILFLFAIIATPCLAQEEDPFNIDNEASTPTISGTMPGVPDILNVIDKATTPEADEERPEWSTPVKLVVIFTVLAILPSVMAMTTSFTRIIIVLGFVRRALSTQSIPPNTAVLGLALFLTLYTMAPTFYKINEQAIQPYINNEIDFEQTTRISSELIKEFMVRQTRKSDLTLFVKMARIKAPKTAIELPLHIVVPSFIISEFRTAFEIGCLMFIPFLLLDLVVASILLSAGMMMLPPVMISLPFKLILFILIDGWGILAHSLSLSFK
jgi:flagellar biosynthetic protein FliP